MMFCRIENTPVVLIDMEDRFFLLELSTLHSGLIDMFSFPEVCPLLSELIFVDSVATSLVIRKEEVETGISRFVKR